MHFVGLDKLSLLDYPNKVACILFTSGCNFRCPFCHNGLTLLEDCHLELKFDDILAFLKKRRGILDGVVISGGEPTLVPKLKDYIKQIKDIGFLVKLDTNGTNPNVIEDLINSNLIDYVAMDVKNSLSRYAETCGVKSLDTIKILKSIELLKQNKVDYEFRTTLVKELHEEEDIIKMGNMLKGAKKLYLQKFKISDGVLNKNLHPLDRDSANHFKDILSDFIELVQLRGY